MAEVIGQTQVGAIERIPNLKKRQRSIYYQPINQTDGSVQWLETRPLPSDAQGRELYLSKGFRLSIPTEPATPEEADKEKEVLLSENADLRNQLKMANARAARKPKESLSSTL